MDITGDSISYTNTDTASLPLEFSMAYDEGNYNFSPLNAAKVTFDVAPNQTITITKKDTGFALTTNMECKEEESSGGNQITKEILPAEDS